jgi:hypothetical protein
MKHAPADSLLDEFREVALFGALCAQIGAQGKVGLFRDFNLNSEVEGGFIGII